MDERAERTGPARERLLATAAEMFYRDGVTATGVDAITRESGVSKPTLYSHFRSKPALVAGVLRYRHDGRREELQGYLADLEQEGAGRIVAVFDWLVRRAEEPNFRGCAFLNAAAELAAPPDEDARTVVRQHKAWWRGLFSDLAEGVGLEAPDELGEQLLLLLDGAYARSSVERASEPVRVARKLAVQLLRLHGAQDLAEGEHR